MAHKVTLDYQGIDPVFSIENSGFNSYSIAHLELPTFLTGEELETLRSHIEGFEHLYNLELSGAPRLTLEGVQLYFHLVELGAPREVAFRVMNAAGELGSVEAFTNLMELGVPFVAIDHRGNFISNIEHIFTLQHYMAPEVANAIGLFAGSDLQKLSIIADSVSQRDKKVSLSAGLNKAAIYPLLGLMKGGVEPDIAIWVSSIVKDWDAVAELERNKLPELEKDPSFASALGIFNLPHPTRVALLVYIYSSLGPLAIERTLNYLLEQGVTGRHAPMREVLALMEYFASNEELGQTAWAWLMSSLLEGDHESTAIG